MQARTKFWRWFYNTVAPFYDATLKLGARLGVSSETNVRQDVFNRLELTPHSLVLDIGCGTGGNRLLAGNEIICVGLDISRGMLHRAQAKCRQCDITASWVQADAHALPLRAAHGDVVISMGMLQHLSLPKQALGEIWRVCKSTGEILLIDERRSLRRFAKGLTAIPGRNEIANSTKIIDWMTGNLEVDHIERKIIGEYFVFHINRTSR